jgi:hypothetical protein
VPNPPVGGPRGRSRQPPAGSSPSRGCPKATCAMSRLPGARAARFYDVAPSRGLEIHSRPRDPKPTSDVPGTCRQARSECRSVVIGILLQARSCRSVIVWEFAPEARVVSSPGLRVSANPRIVDRARGEEATAGALRKGSTERTGCPGTSARGGVPNPCPARRVASLAPSHASTKAHLQLQRNSLHRFVIRQTDARKAHGAPVLVYI